MKIRSGFVSNSSSSSFILTYQKSMVITDPEKIVDIVRDYPYEPMIIRGWDLSDGEDIFELDNEQRSLIRKFPKKFIEMNKGEVTRTNYVYNPETKDYDHEDYKVPAIRAYLDAQFLPDPYEYESPEVDMSDVEKPEDITQEELCKYYEDKEGHPETAKKLEYANNYYNLERERSMKAANDKRDALMQEEIDKFVAEGIPREDVGYELVHVDYRTSEDDIYDFAERYITKEEFGSGEETHITNGRQVAPFVIFYDELLTSKKEILKYLKEHEDTHGVVYWTNEVYNYLSENSEVNIDFYKVGKQEREVLIKGLSENDDTREMYFAVNGTINDKIAPSGKKYILGYGNLAIIEEGQDLVDLEGSLTPQ